ncbi:hypothetical protein J2853_003016 [Streptosporangium lutulentum]|uniref:Uncharacterized protein n=1 Tax=Streptosporangium lutulentum TaxID=1461250 RepID=A0ABT9QAK7_9ACTN|nr:hypothetical protein [Streptosporangium lutulentum]
MLSTRRCPFSHSPSRWAYGGRTADADADRRQAAGGRRQAAGGR